MAWYLRTRTQQSAHARLRALGALCAVVATAAFSLPAGAAPSSLEQSAAAGPHPTAYGAPFLPLTVRNDAVIARADKLVKIDELELAEDTIARRGANETERILASQKAVLERELAALEPTLDQLAQETLPFGIEVGVFPLDELRKPFRNDWGEPRSGGRRHRGNDMLAQLGVPLRAIEDGVFEKSTNGSLGGLGVYIVGDSGTRYYYAHLQSVVDLEEGSRVYAGQLIGTNGDSGNARGSPHLHLQIAPDGETGWENPYPLMAALFGPLETPGPDSFGTPQNAPR